MNQHHRGISLPHSLVRLETSCVLCNYRRWFLNIYGLQNYLSFEFNCELIKPFYVHTLVFELFLNKSAHSNPKVFSIPLFSIFWCNGITSELFHGLKKNLLARGTWHKTPCGDSSLVFIITYFDDSQFFGDSASDERNAAAVTDTSFVDIKIHNLMQ